MLSSRFKLLLPLIAGLILFSSFPTRVQAAPPKRLEISGDGATGWNITNLKPGDSGSKTLTLRSNYREGSVLIWTSNIINVEGTSPEFQTGGRGDLSRYLKLKPSASSLVTNISLPTTLDNFPQSASDTRFISVDYLAPGSPVELRWEWRLPPETGNDVQGDSLSFTIHYLLEEIEVSEPFAGVSAEGKPGEKEPEPVTPVHFITIEPADKVTSLKTVRGRVAESYVISLLGKRLVLSFDRDTKITGALPLVPGEIVPDKLVVEVSSEEPPIPESMARVSPIYDLSAYIFGQKCASVILYPPIRIIINYDPKELPETTSAVYVAYYDREQGWIHLEPPAGFVAEEGQVGGLASHLSLFAVIADVKPVPSKPARFEMGSLRVSSAVVKPGETVTVTVVLTNVGELAGEYILRLNIEGLLKTSRLVKLAQKQSRDITFSVVPISPGQYKIEIGDLRGEFIVAAPPEVPEPVSVNYIWLIVGITALTAIITWLVMRRHQEHHSTEES